MKNEDSSEYFLKLLIRGDSYVEKSSIVERFILDQFYNISLTVQVLDFIIKQQKNYLQNIYLNIFSHNEFDRKIKIQLWDRKGAERFKIILPQEIINMKGVLFIYDITKRQSYQKLFEMVGEYIKAQKESNVVLVLVGNKCDLEIERQVTYKEGQQLANSFGMKFFETSAKSSKNVNICFDELINQILFLQ